MKFRLPRKLKKFLKKKGKWVDKKSGEDTYPWNSQLDYKKYKSGELAPFLEYIDPTI